MRVTIHPSPLSGTITPPPSKSQAHRLILAAALCPGDSEIQNLTPSQDISATVSCMEALGAAVDWSGDAARLRGASPQAGPLPALDCGESGSTLRFLMPVALALRGGGVFRGRGRLMQRPQTPYFDLFREQNIVFSQKDDTLYLEGTLRPGTFRLPGNVSSQFITGLLYALPLLDGDSEICLTTPLESAGYVDMTLESLALAGISAEATNTGWAVPGRQRYRPIQAAVEADYSQAAFFFAAQSLGCPVKIAGLRADSRQGDRVIAEYQRAMATPGDLSLDVSGCPDLVPALAAMAALRAGKCTRLTGAGRLRLKESDRLASVTNVLTRLGAEIQEGEDFLAISGKARLPGGTEVDAWNDHRIAMMAAVAAIGCERSVTVLGAECVRKSYPRFWEDYAALGGKLEVQA